MATRRGNKGTRASKHRVRKRSVAKVARKAAKTKRAANAKATRVAAKATPKRSAAKRSATTRTSKRDREHMKTAAVADDTTHASATSAAPAAGVESREGHVEHAAIPETAIPTESGVISGAVRVAGDDVRQDVKRHLFGDWYNVFEFLRGPARVPGDLDLDLTSIDCLVVDGDLIVEGSIINRDSTRGVGLLVLGSVRAKNLIAAGSEIVILGDLVIDGVIYGYYNTGSITVHRATRAKAIITELHTFDLRGPIDAITISGRGSITERDHYTSYAPALVADVLTGDNLRDGYPDSRRTTDAILSGRPVLRPSA